MVGFCVAVGALNPPEALITVTNFPITSRGRHIRWPQPPTTGLIGYDITVRSQPRTSSRRKRQVAATQTFMVDANALEASIENQPFSTVSVDVVANYMPAGSTTVASVPVVQGSTFVSGEDVPSMPLNVRATLLGLNRFSITWDTPANPNGIIRNHRVSAP